MGFGDSWEHGSIAEIFKKSIAGFPIIFSKPVDKLSTEILNEGGAPKLPALNLHNGTVYRWNRTFTEQYPLPLVFGIEEYLEGALLSYINELGYIAFGFEGGQHDDLVSVENNLSFLLLTLVFAGMISKKDFYFERCFNALAKNTVNRQKFYEIFIQFKLKDQDQFVMEPGYVLFQHIEKGKKLANFNGKEIRADQDAMIFMPLYQDQGSEGFFAIREVSPRFLRISRWLRLKR